MSVTVKSPQENMQHGIQKTKEKNFVRTSRERERRVILQKLAGEFP